MQIDSSSTKIDETDRCRCLIPEDTNQRGVSSVDPSPAILYSHCKIVFAHTLSNVLIKKRTALYAGITTAITSLCMRTLMSLLWEKIENRLSVDSRELYPQACRQRRSKIDYRYFAFKGVGRQILAPRYNEALRPMIPRAGVGGLYSKLTHAL